MKPAFRKVILEAAKQMDWQQVVLNGGPTCFRLMPDGKFCGRAHSWQGHGGVGAGFHDFISFETLLENITDHS